MREIAFQALSKLVKRDGCDGLWEVSQQTFNRPHRVRMQQHIAANRADLRRDMIDDDDIAFVANRMNDGPGFVGSAASLNGTGHSRVLLCSGVGHFGGLGS